MTYREQECLRPIQPNQNNIRALSWFTFKKIVIRIFWLFFQECDSLLFLIVFQWSVQSSLKTNQTTQNQPKKNLEIQLQLDWIGYDLARSNWIG